MSATQTSKGLSSYGRLGFLLLAIGGVLALDNFAGWSFLHKLWPVLILVLGGGFIGIHIHRGRREALYMATGVFTLQLGALFLYCSLSGWSHLATLWPLFLGFLGVAFCAGYAFGGRYRSLLAAGLVLVFLSVVFFLVLSVEVRLWWTSFLFAGAVFIVLDRLRRHP